jgi:hypothetical protein
MRDDFLARIIDWANTTKHGEAAAEILAILNPEEPVKPAKKAAAANVSRALGTYRLEDGGRLRRAHIRHTQDGPYEWGGYKVFGKPNQVVVKFVPDDSMLFSVAEKAREEMLALYTEILVSKGYIVRRSGHLLYVSR